MTINDLKKKLTDVCGLLSVPGIGRGRYHRLIKSFGHPENVLSASIKQLEAVPGIAHNTAVNLSGYQIPDTVSRGVARVIQLGWGVIFCDDDNFPTKLLNIPKSDIPPVLFYKGLPLELDEPAIAIVGSRHASDAGKQFAYRLSRDLAAAGVTVVSGMAEGIDSLAHRGALEGSGKTIAAWGNSLDIVYPPSNKQLAEQIIEKGTVLSEYLPETEPDRAHFPQRNRIISGLSDGVVVVEAGQKSGALITANEALKQNRELFAVPGSPEAKLSEGSNRLIKKGAKLITSADDIFEELPRLKGVVMTKQFIQKPDMTDMERKIVNLFQSGPRQVDNISREINLSVPELMEFLLALELKGVIKELSGKRFMISEEYV